MREAWKKICISDPKPMDEGDLKDHLPWWDRYEDVVYTEVIEDDGQDEEDLKHTSSYIHALEVPEARTDPSHPAEKWQLASAEEKVQHRIRRAEEKHQKSLARRNRPTPESMYPPVPPMEDRRLQPRSNMYIRPVQPADVRAIAVSLLDLLRFHA